MAISASNALHPGAVKRLEKAFLKLIFKLPPIKSARGTKIFKPVMTKDTALGP